MTDRIFQDTSSFEVSDKGREIEIYVFQSSSENTVKDQVMVTVKEEDGWDSQSARFTMTAAEATAMKNFLISKGY